MPQLNVKKSFKKYLLTHTTLNNILNKVQQKSIKGQTLADFVVDNLILVEWELSNDLPDEDVLSLKSYPHGTNILMELHIERG